MVFLKLELSRFGHRMVNLKSSLIILGGFRLLDDLNPKSDNLLMSTCSNTFGTIVAINFELKN